MTAASEPAVTTFDELMQRHQAGVWRYLRALAAGPALKSALARLRATLRRCVETRLLKEDA